MATKLSGSKVDIDIFVLIAAARAKYASDLHLSAYSPPLVRVNGCLQSLNGPRPLTEAEIRSAMEQMATIYQVEEFDKRLELDFGHKLPDGTSLRCSIAQQRGSVSMVIRILPSRIPTLDELELPAACKRLVTLRRGLLVISGPTGSGKTTTQAAMINYLNCNRTLNIVTIEDPIEYFHNNIKSAIIQRELGGDTRSYAQALKHVLRHDPDVILVGEMRDSETAAAVLSLAETGHLVITTSHAAYVGQTIERIIDLFPSHERPQAQIRLASLLNAIICQTLVPRANGKGRIAAVEILMVNPAVSNIIRDSKFNQLGNAMRSFRQVGMISLDQALVDLFHSGVISGETVFNYCNDADEARKLLY
jgi:twitching motility protein PilT